MKRVEISVINDLVTDQRLKRMVGTMLSMGMEVHVVGRKLPGSMDMGDVDFSYRRFAMLFRKGPLFYVFYNLRLFFYLMFRQKADLYIAIDLDTLSATYLLSRLRKVPLLYDSHEYFTEVPELVGRPRVQRFWETIEGWIVPRLQYAMAVSDSISAVYMEKYGVEFVTVRNLSKAVEFTRKLDIQEKYRASFTIIYQGALNKGRGLEQAIKAMHWLNDVRLLIVGGGDVSDDLISLAKQEGVEEKVVFMGKVSPEALKLITLDCHLGISLEEDLGLNYRMALPNKIFDYIQARIPVLCSDLPEMAAVIRDYELGEVCISRDPEDLAQQIHRMLTSNDGIRHWVECLEKAAGELVWEKEEAKLRFIVAQAIGESRE